MLLLEYTWSQKSLCMTVEIRAPRQRNAIALNISSPLFLSDMELARTQDPYIRITKCFVTNTEKLLHINTKVRTASILLMSQKINEGGGTLVPIRERES